MLLFRALQAETLKLKNTLALRLAWIGPLSVAGLVFLMYLNDGRTPGLQSGNAWRDLGQMINILWTLIVLPLFITLQTALLAGIEHGSGQWKRLYALPVPRWGIYVAKQIAAAGLIGLSHILLAALTLIAGLLLWAFLPGAGFDAPVPWSDMLLPILYAYLGSWLILALHTWIGQRWPSFALASAVGIVLTVAGVAVVQSEWASYYPWALPGLLVNGLHKGEPLARAELIFGSLGGVVAMAVGAFEVTRRDVL